MPQKAVPVENILSFEDARRCVEKHASGLASSHFEAVSLLDSAGRFLAEDIAADRDFPPFRRATRDGFAVLSGDLLSLPANLKVTSRIKAGDARTAPVLRAGECAEIMTGAPVPEGADAVVMVEYTRENEFIVTVERSVRAGENIVPTGSEARKGQVLLSKGTRMGHAQTGLAAAVGKTTVQVHHKPRIAILSTGDEIVDIGAMPGAHQMRNSNSYSLAAQVLAAGGDPIQLPIAPDDRARLRPLIKEGLEADLLILSGGVSMGKYDLVKEVLGEFDAEFFFTGAHIQPGRPVVFGRAKTGARRTYFFGLPGNPISTMVTFELFTRAVVEALAGGKLRPLHFTCARLAAPIKTKTGLTRFLPGILKGDHHSPTVELVAWQGSGDLAAVSRADCYVVIPPDREQIEAGETITVLAVGS